jgi:hypothetical protein
MPRLNSNRPTGGVPLDFETVHASFPPEMVARLDAHARSLGLPRSGVLRLAVRDWIEAQPPLPPSASARSSR